MSITPEWAAGFFPPGTLIRTHESAKLGYRLAAYSPDETLRYALQIVWDDRLPTLMVCGLNPSTATELKDDNTVRRCRGFATSWGYGSLLMANLVPFRSTDPRGMHDWVTEQSFGPHWAEWIRLNAAMLEALSVECGLYVHVIAAWGRHGTKGAAMQHVTRAVLDRFRDCSRTLHRLGCNQEGSPLHPLYAPASRIPEVYQ